MKIGIVGSINVDFVTVAKRIPFVGETIVGETFQTVMGGKGANVAVAIGRLGGNVAMFGAIGGDDFGQQAINNFKENNVDTNCIATLENESTGTASITVAEGNNAIIVIGGANDKIDENFINTYEKQLEKCGIIGTQLEIDPSAALWLSRFAKKNNIKFIFNQSPDKKYDKEIIKNATVIIVNEIEINDIGGEKALASYPNKLILTEGDKGVRFHDGNKIVHTPTPKIKVVDTVGAGDTFMGSLIVKMSEGATLEECIQFATVAASLKCTKLGAQTAMPSRKEVDEKLKSQNQTEDY